MSVLLRLRPRHWSRETRLLVVTIVLSVSVLLLLARFRFPSQEPLQLPAQPLQRLAARAAFDDLSAAVMRASDRVRPSLFVVMLSSPEPEARRSFSLAEVLRHDRDVPVQRLAVAYRFRPTHALVMTTAPAAAFGRDAVRGTSLRARDELRGVTVLQTEAAGGDWQALATSSPVAPQYLLVAEATPAGVMVRPLFGASADRFESPQWDAPLLALGQDVRAPHGSLVFSLDGAFVGAVTTENGPTAIVPADALTAAANRLLSTPPRPLATFGLRLQALDPALAAATGTTAGVMISAVQADGPSAGLLRPGDVLRTANGESLTAPDTALLTLAALDPSRACRFDVWRDGAGVEVLVTPRAIAAAERVMPSELGLTLRRASRGSVVAQVAPLSVAEQAGLQAGDLIAWAGAAQAPPPEAVLRAYAAQASGSALLVGVERGGQPLVVALPHP
jgi:hypothetical protein